jgi:hypothetical protein
MGESWGSECLNLFLFQFSAGPSHFDQQAEERCETASPGRSLFVHNFPCTGSARGQALPIAFANLVCQACREVG